MIKNKKKKKEWHGKATLFAWATPHRVIPTERKRVERIP